MAPKLSPEVPPQVPSDFAAKSAAEHRLGLCMIALVFAHTNAPRNMLIYDGTSQCQASAICSAIEIGP